MLFRRKFELFPVLFPYQLSSTQARTKVVCAFNTSLLKLIGDMAKASIYLDPQGYSVTRCPLQESSLRQELLKSIAISVDDARTFDFDGRVVVQKKTIALASSRA